MTYDLAEDDAVTAELDCGGSFRWFHRSDGPIGLLAYDLAARPPGVGGDDYRYLAHLGAIQQCLMTAPVARAIGLPPPGRMPIDVEDLPPERVQLGPELNVDGEPVPAWVASIHGYDFILSDPTRHHLAVMRPAGGGPSWPKLVTR